MSSSKKNIIKNAASSFAQKGVRVLEQLFLIPFFIIHWGTDYYGEWITLTIIPSVLAFSDLGLGSAAANSFVLKYVSGQFREAADILKTAFVTISVVIMAAIMLGGLSIFAAIKFEWLKHSLIPAQDACYALAFMILARLFGFYMQLYEANFRAVRKAHLAINLQSLGAALNVAVGFVTLMLGYGVVGFAFWQMVIALLYNIFYGLFAYNIIPNLKTQHAIVRRPLVKEFFTLGMGYLMSPLWQSILFQGTTLVVRLTLGPTAVAMFNTVRTLSRSVNQLYSIINSSVFPEIQFEIGLGNLQKAQKILLKSIKITAGIATIGLIAMATIGLPIYNWWTKNELSPPYMLWLLLIISTTINAVWWTGGVVFRAMNKPYQLSLSGVIFSVIAVGITFFGCRSFGIVGAGIGALSFEIGMVLYLFPKCLRLLKN